MIYKFLRYPLLVLFTFFYKRIYLSNTHKIPKKAPILIVSNHSTAMMEQILVAAFQPRGVYFWARASVFTSKALSWFFNQVHMIPIFRKQEGLGNMRKNEAIFRQSEQLVLNGQALYIAPEGNCVLEKRLRKFRTGTARIGLGAAASTNFQEPVYIVPVGANYTYHAKFRAEVIINVGDPILVNDYAELYQKNPKEAANKLTADMKVAVRNEMVYIENPEDEELAEKMLIFYRNSNAEDTLKPIIRNTERLKIEQKVTNTINQASSEEKQKLSELVNAYQKIINKNNIQDIAVASNTQNSIFSSIKMILGAPIAAVGAFVGWLPFTIARSIRNKAVNDLQFWAPMSLIFSFLSWLVYGGIMAGIGAFFIGWWSLLLPVGAVLGQYFALVYKESFDRYKAVAQWNSFHKKNNTIAQTIITKRKSVKNQLEQLANTQNITTKSKKEAIA